MAGCYIIVSRLNGLVLAPEGANPMPGVRVAPFPRTGDTSQQFYDDVATGTIRCALNNLCLDIEGGDKHLRLMPFQPGDPNQQWHRDDHGCIRNRVQQKKVLDIFYKNQSPGANIGMYDHNGGPNQLWHFEFVGPQSGGYSQGYPGVGQTYPGQQAYPGQYPQPGGYPGYPAQTFPGQGYPGQGQVYPAQPAPQPVVQKRKEFFIVSELNGKVLDVKGADKNPGAHLIMWGKKSPPASNQLWYLDQQGVIRSALNDLGIHANANDKARLEPFNQGRSQEWVVDGKKITNRSNGQCLDVFGAHTHEGADVGSYQYGNKSNQHWKIEYV